ncbi:MAG: nucleoside phosphorylase [Clostridia bacterium]|nr:nucleoside phosphorylase [Clostridia bacterium]
MIIDSYHEEKESIISLEAFLGERKYICDTAIATFSYEIFNAVIQRYPHKEVADIGSVNGHKPIYMLDVNGKSVIFYMSSIGACLAGTEIIEMQWQTGIKNLIIFGSCGALDGEATNGKYIIPTQAYRDEGMSYHYAKPSDYMDVKNSDKLAGIFEKLDLPYVQGRIWTTDAPYRETKTACEERKKDGCIAVEMEISGIQAVCNFYGIELYSFIVSGDVLDGEKYIPDGLSEANHSLDKFFIALKIWEYI